MAAPPVYAATFTEFPRARTLTPPAFRNPGRQSPITVLPRPCTKYRACLVSTGYHDSIRPAGKQFLFRDRVDSLQEPSLVFCALTKSEQRVRVTHRR